MIRKALISTVALLLAGAGCSSEGFSPREVHSQNYPAFVYSGVDNRGLLDGSTTAPVVHMPAKVAVAQVGEVAPPQVMLDDLRLQKTLFGHVESLPGVFDFSPSENGNLAANATGTDYQARERVEQMRSAARNLGMDYLFIMGGTIDQSGNQTPLSILNLTVVGVFVVPTHEYRAVGKAGGSLMDARTGRIVFTVSADADRTCMVPEIASGSGPAQLMETVRGDLVQKITKDMVREMKAQGGGSEDKTDVNRS